MRKIKVYLIIIMICLFPLVALSQLIKPEIKKIAPDRGKVGESIIITGTGFGNQAGSVLFGDTEATIISWSDARIIAAISLGSSSGSLKVITLQGIAEKPFTVIPSWNIYSSPTNTFLSAVAFRSPGDGWIMERTGEGENFHFNGKQWEACEKIDSSWISNISFLPSGKGWAVGGAGTILYFNGKKWERSATSVTADDLNDVFFLSPTNGWAVGGEGRIIHYFDWTVNDISWRKDNTVTDFDTLNAVHFISPDKGWAMGRDGVILEYNKNKWVKINSPTGSVLYSIGFASKNNGWAVGANGTIIQYNGRAWVAFPSPVRENLNLVFMVSDKDGWIVGDEGVILHYDGNIWEKQDSPTRENLHDIYFVAPDDGWAVGEQGIILRYH